MRVGVGQRGAVLACSWVGSGPDLKQMPDRRHQGFAALCFILMILPHLGATCGADTTGGAEGGRKGAGEGGIGRGEGGEEVEKEERCWRRRCRRRRLTQSPSLPVVRSTVSYSRNSVFC